MTKAVETTVKNREINIFAAYK